MHMFHVKRVVAMGLAVVTVAAGGLAVVEAANALPVIEAANGFGVAVTKVVGKPGLPVTFVAPPLAGDNDGEPD